MLPELGGYQFQFPNFPANAWENGLFVILMIFLVIIMLNSQAREQKVRDSLIEKINASWQKWIDDRRKFEDQRLEALQRSLEALTLVVQSLTNQVLQHRADFMMHDKAEWEKFDALIEAWRQTRLVVEEKRESELEDDVPPNQRKPKP